MDDNNKKETARAEINKAVFQAFKDGYIVIYTVDGLERVPIENFVKQPLEGMLYDMNHLETVIRTHAAHDEDFGWVNDMAMLKTLEYFYNKTNNKSD